MNAGGNLWRRASQVGAESYVRGPDLVAERDRARDLAVALENENAELTRLLTQACAILTTEDCPGLIAACVGMGIEVPDYGLRQP